MAVRKIQDVTTEPARQSDIASTVIRILPPTWQKAFHQALQELPLACQEIRIRVNQAPCLVYGGGQLPITSFQVAMGDIAYIMDKVSSGSLYAFEEEMRQGYLTLPGGHRLGFSGQAVVKEGYLQRIKNYNSLNIRVARAYPGCAQKIIPEIWDRQRRQMHHTLILSPPRGGKTTVLREVVRVFSYGSQYEKIPPHHISVVDERSEVAGCYQGIPQFDVGPNTDILDGCPKVSGVMLMVRAMSPQIVAVDELGSGKDIDAIAEISQAGVRLVATAHATDFNQLRKRPLFQQLIEAEFFERFVVLMTAEQTGQIAALLDSSGHVIKRWGESCLD